MTNQFLWRTNFFVSWCNFFYAAAAPKTVNKTASRHENGNKFDPSSAHLGNNLPPTIAESSVVYIDLDIRSFFIL